ncbi:MAG: diphosphomevalonate decarboxylase [Myxococcales bacterium]|nr:diphosphomevalonate decarboxylase [Myxococcales bacterium]
MTHAIAVAHPNIALAKYWGKREHGRNLPSVPSLSITLAGMTTTTRVELAAMDTLELNGVATVGRACERAVALLDLIWQEAGRERQHEGQGEGQGEGERPRLRIVSHNDFPTSAGLASSASAFAALAVAANAVLATGHSTERLSSLARRISASAGRSLYGGFVELPAGGDEAEPLFARPLAAVDHWPLRLVVAVTTETEKEVGSTEGMNATSRTSPLYAGWLAAAPDIFARIRAAVLARDLETVGLAVEESALTMHATALAAQPGILYWNGATVEVMHAVRRLRRQGLPAYFTIDAGPHVKVLTLASHAAAVTTEIAAIPGVLRTISAEPGEGARLIEASGTEPAEGARLIEPSGAEPGA